MKFSPKCRTKKLGMIYTIPGCFCSFLIGKGLLFGPKSGLGKFVKEFAFLLFIMLLFFV